MKCGCFNLTRMSRKALDSIPVATNDLSDYIDKRKAKNHAVFFDEFEKLYFSAIRQLDREYIQGKDRYTNTMAFEHSRVKLRLSPREAAEDEDADYINANYVAPFDEWRKYIAAQGPLPDTVDDFWRMCWQEDVVTIVMVTRLAEGKKQLCEKYWPDWGTAPMQCGHFRVSTTTQQNMGPYVVSQLQVEKGSDKRMVTHYYFTEWKDHSSTDPHQLLKLVSDVRQAASWVSGPVLVHCSAGIGRTGAFIAVDLLREKLLSGAKIVDVFGTVYQLRQERAEMVQDPEQYMLIYDALKIVVDSLEPLNGR